MDDLIKFRKLAARMDKSMSRLFDRLPKTSAELDRDARELLEAYGSWAGYQEKQASLASNLENRR